MRVLETWLKKQILSFRQQGEEMKLLDIPQDTSGTRSKPGTRVIREWRRGDNILYGVWDGLGDFIYNEMKILQTQRKDLGWDKGQRRVNLEERKHRAVRGEKRWCRGLHFGWSFRNPRIVGMGGQQSWCPGSMKAGLQMVKGLPGGWLWPSLRVLNRTQQGNVQFPKRWK